MALRINSFPDDQRIWRIDWLSGVGYPDRSAMHGQPSLMVRLSEVDASGRSQHPRRLFNCFVSIGTLVLLRVGDLWQGRQLLASPPEGVEEWTLEIAPARASTIKAGLSVSGDFLLPLSEHPGHARDTMSYCVKVSLPDERVMVVPTWELIRFYFGSSSTLLERLFRPPLQKSDLFTNDRWVAGTGHLDLAEGIRRRSAHDVARIAFNEIAFDAAKLIGNSCALQATEQSGPIYPRTKFPFHGQTKLRAKGRWLSHGTKTKQTFLVYELLSCSHPFPYHELRYTLHPATEKAQLKLAPANAAGSSAVLSGKPAVDGLVQEDASAKHAGREAYLRRKSQFPDLDFKPTLGTVALATPEEGAGGKAVSRKATPGAVGGQTSSGRIGGVVLDAGEQSRPPEFLASLLSALASTRCPSQLLTGGGPDGWTVGWPLEPGGEKAAPDARVRLQMSAFALTHGDRTLTIVAVAGEKQVRLVLLPASEQPLREHLDLAYKSAFAPDSAAHSASPSEDPLSLESWLRQGLQTLDAHVRIATFATLA